MAESREIGVAYESLCGAICEQAVKDYRAALLLGKKGKAHRERIERFFRGQWFMWLVNGRVEGEFVIEKVREQCRMSKHS